MESFKKYISDELAISIKAKQDFIQKNISEVLRAAELVAQVTLNNGKVIYFGNGGSAADAQHLAAEHVNKLRVKRQALPAIAITTDTSIISSIANDISFEEIFSRQLEALANPLDLAVGLSTSGDSKNVIRGLKKAKELGLKTIAFTGGSGGIIKKDGLADIILNVEGSDFSARIQETHIFLGHILIELMDKIVAK
jgi:D-sedoheptulose 7-phosphate isomerase